MDFRIDLNGTLNGKLSLEELGQFGLRQMLRFLMEGMTTLYFDFTGIELTDTDATSVWKVFFQLEGTLTHCLQGKTRTAQWWGAVLLALYHETYLNIDDAMEYLSLMRPFFVFAVSDHCGSPLVPTGGQLGEPSTSLCTRWS